MSVGARAAAGLAGLAFLAGCQLVLDFSSEVEAPVADASVQPDAAAPDAAVSPCDAFEPNETSDAPRAIEPGTFAASICGGSDQDYFSFTVDGSQDVDILLTFEAGSNDLELELYTEGSGVALVLSTGSDGDEQIQRALAQENRLAAGTYIIRVFGRVPGVENSYQLTLQRGVIAGPAR